MVTSKKKKYDLYVVQKENKAVHRDEKHLWVYIDNWIVSCKGVASIIWTSSTGCLDAKMYKVL